MYATLLMAPNKGMCLSIKTIWRARSSATKSQFELETLTTIQRKLTKGLGKTKGHGVKTPEQFPVRVTEYTEWV